MALLSVLTRIVGLYLADLLYFQLRHFCICLRSMYWQQIRTDYTTCSYPVAISCNYAEVARTNSSLSSCIGTIGLSFAVQSVQLVYLDQLWIALVTVIWWPQGIITQIPRIELKPRATPPHGLPSSQPDWALALSFRRPCFNMLFMGL